MWRSVIAFVSAIGAFAFAISAVAVSVYGSPLWIEAVLIVGWFACMIGLAFHVLAPRRAEGARS